MICRRWNHERKDYDEYVGHRWEEVCQPKYGTLAKRRQYRCGHCKATRTLLVSVLNGTLPLPEQTHED